MFVSAMKNASFADWFLSEASRGGEFPFAAQSPGIDVGIANYFYKVETLFNGEENFAATGQAAMGTFN